MLPSMAAGLRDREDDGLHEMEDKVKLVTRTAFTAIALAASVTLAQAQTAQDHEAHHPSAQGGAQTETTAPPTGDAAPQNQPSASPPGGMMDQGKPGMMGGQGGMTGQQGMMQGCQAMMQGSASPMMQSMMRMHQGMVGASLTGDPDHDFAALMVRQHQGAIDMARAELKDGKNPELRKLAESIVKSQEKEIKQMNRWLGKTASK